MPLALIILLCAVGVLVVLGGLIAAAVLASRSKQRPKELTPTQKTDNPYRKIYKD